MSAQERLYSATKDDTATMGTRMNCDTPTLTDEIRRTLIAARALIDTPGTWCQDRLHKPGGRHCMIGALLWADGHRTWAPPDVVPLLVAHANIALRNAAGVGWHLCGWNDDPDRLHSEVMAVFDEAIANYPETSNT